MFFFFHFSTILNVNELIFKNKKNNNIGTCGYQSGLLVEDMTSGLAEVISNLATKSAFPLEKGVEAAIILLPIGGKVATVAPEATANPHRQAKFWVLLTASWPIQPQDQGRGKVSSLFLYIHI